MAHEPGKIRNVAVVGHRGTGKTSLIEAMLFQAGATNRLGTIEAGSTVSDWDEHELPRSVDHLHMCAYASPEGQREGKAVEIPADMQAQVDEYHTKLLDAVVLTDEKLMERYLEGEELAVEEVAHALKDAVTRGELFPVGCGVATKNLGTTALLDLLVEGVPSPAKKGAPIEAEVERRRGRRGQTADRTSRRRRRGPARGGRPPSALAPDAGRTGGGPREAPFRAGSRLPPAAAASPMRKSARAHPAHPV